MIKLLAVLVAFGVVVTVVILSGGTVPDAIDLHEFPQGVVAVTLQDSGRVFVRREGNFLWAWANRSAKNNPIVWCPHEHVFWSPKALTLYDQYGYIDRTVEAGDDRLRTLTPLVDAETLRVRFRPGPAKDLPAKVGVPKATREFYERWLSRDAIPGGDRLRWCEKPPPLR